MVNLEKVLYDSIMETGNKISPEELSSYAKEQGSYMVSVLLQIIRNSLEEYVGVGTLEHVLLAFDYLKEIISVDCEINRKILIKKISKLEDRIGQLKIDKKNYFVDQTKVCAELGKVTQRIFDVLSMCEEKDTAQYEWLCYLIHDVKNLTYLDYTFRKVPSFFNLKDRNGVSLFRNIILKYLESVEVEEQKNVQYYGNLVSFFVSQPEFDLEKSEMRKCLDKVYCCLNKNSCTKRLAKQNRQKIEWIKALKELIVPEEKGKSSLEQLALQYHIPISFDEVLQAFAYSSDVKMDDDSVHSIVDEYIITIDGLGAIEIDDALSCQKLPNGNYLLGVHIANVLSYFSYNHPLIEESFERGRSIYLPKRYQGKEGGFHKIIPIFPYNVATNIASLKEGSPRFTRSFYFEIDSYGDVISERFPKTIITNNKKMTYHEVNDILEHGCSDLPLHETIHNLREVTELLGKRYKSSALFDKAKKKEIDSVETNILDDNAGKIVFHPMLLTGNRVAEYFANAGYPCIYRVHEIDEDTNKKIESMAKTLMDTYGGAQVQKLYNLISGIYPKGWYDVKGDHKGLGVKHYCHCTAGLRRSQDNIVSHALDVCYDKKPTDQEVFELEEEIDRRVGQINTKNKMIDWFLADYARSLKKVKR